MWTRFSRMFTGMVGAVLVQLGEIGVVDDFIHPRFQRFTLPAAPSAPLAVPGR